MIFSWGDHATIHTMTLLQGPKDPVLPTLINVHTFFSFILIISNLILIPKTNEKILDAIFQPLLQIYLLLPCVIARMSCQQSSNVIPLSEFFTGSLQTYSIVSSVVSLAWSFSTYEANQKKGALDFSSKPIARIVILLAALLQVIYEITIIKMKLICKYSIQNEILKNLSAL